jgi:AraC-like DNA-binding protein
MRIPSAQLLAPLSTDVISFGPKEANLRSSQLIVQKAANILRNNLREPPALADLAAQLSLTERTCKRRLQEAGTHYQQLLADLRLEQAHYWLNQRICNVSQAAERLGYSSVANFSKAFKKWSGYSPTHAKQRREPEPA